MAASKAIVGTALTLECTVSVVPHLITTPHVELIGPGGFVLASSANLSLTHALDAVNTLNAGQYVCKAVLEIESVNVLYQTQSTIHPLSLQCK